MYTSQNKTTARRPRRERSREELILSSLVPFFSAARSVDSTGETHGFTSQEEDTKKEHEGGVIAGELFRNNTKGSDDSLFKTEEAYAPTRYDSDQNNNKRRKCLSIKSTTSKINSGSTTTGLIQPHNFQGLFLRTGGVIVLPSFEIESYAHHENIEEMNELKSNETSYENHEGCGSNRCKQEKNSKDGINRNIDISTSHQNQQQQEQQQGISYKRSFSKLGVNNPSHPDYRKSSHRSRSTLLLDAAKNLSKPIMMSSSKFFLPGQMMQNHSQNDSDIDSITMQSKRATANKSQPSSCSPKLSSFQHESLSHQQSKEQSQRIMSEKTPPRILLENLLRGMSKLCHARLRLSRNALLPKKPGKISGLKRRKQDGSDCLTETKILASLLSAKRGTGRQTKQDIQGSEEMGYLADSAVAVTAAVTSFDVVWDINNTNSGDEREERLMEAVNTELNTGKEEINSNTASIVSTTPLVKDTGVGVQRKHNDSGSPISPSSKSARIAIKTTEKTNLTLPIAFKAVVDIKVLGGKVLTIPLSTSGTVIGTFAYSSPQDTTEIKEGEKNIVSDSSNKALFLSRLEVRLDTVSLLSCMTTQVRIVVREVIQNAVAIMSIVAQQRNVHPKMSLEMQQQQLRCQLHQQQRQLQELQNQQQGKSESCGISISNSINSVTFSNNNFGKDSSINKDVTNVEFSRNCNRNEDKTYVNDYSDNNDGIGSNASSGRNNEDETTAAITSRLDLYPKHLRDTFRHFIPSSNMGTIEDTAKYPSNLERTLRSLAFSDDRENLDDDNIQ